MDPVVVVAFIGLAGIFGTGVVSPLILAHLNGRAAIAAKEADSTATIKQKAAEAQVRREEREEDWRRQDEVAARAEAVATAAEAVARQAAEAAKLLLTSNAKVAVAAKKASDETIASRLKMDTTTAAIGTQLEVIHTLVNSNYTKALQNLLDSTERELASLEEIVDLKRTAGREPTPGALAAVGAAKVKIIELRVEVAERVKADALVVAQLGAPRNAADTDRIVDAIKNLPGQGGAPQEVSIVTPAGPQEVTIVQPATDPVPVTQAPPEP